MLPARNVVAQQRWRFVQVDDENIYVAIVVEIAECAAAAAVLRDDPRPGFGRNLLETPVPEAAEDDTRSSVGLVWSVPAAPDKFRQSPRKCRECHHCPGLQCQRPS